MFWKALGLSLLDSELGRFPKGLTGRLSFSPRGFLSQGYETGHWLQVRSLICSPGSSELVRRQLLG